MQFPRQPKSEQNLLTRRHWLNLVLFGCLGGLAAPSFVSADTDKVGLVLAVDDISSMVHLPVMLAHQLGYFKAEGLRVDIVEQPV
ncbi:MAG: ABC transporter substrate-binding protein, partial [Limnohabitans sp.]